MSEGSENFQPGSGLFWQDLERDLLNPEFADAFRAAIADIERLQCELAETEMKAGQWERAAEERYELLIDQTRQAHKAHTALRKIRLLVDHQAEDEMLWSVPLDNSQPITEAYLQQELRHLHNAIEEATNE